MAHTSRWHSAAGCLSPIPGLHPCLTLLLRFIFALSTLGSLAAVAPFAVTARAQEITPESAPAPQSSPAPAPAAPTPAPAAGKGPALRVLAPADHMPAWLQKQITTRTGANVALDPYKTDEEALQKAMKAAPAYDLVAVSDRVASELIRAQKLSPVTWPLNKDLVYNRYRGHYFDQENHFTLAYAVSLSGYAYKIADFPKPPNGWDDVLGSADMAGIYWRPDPSWRLALLRHAGKSAETNDARLTAPPAATARLVVDTIPELCRRFARDSRNWKIVLPNNGSIITLYQVAIPVGAEHPREALGAVQEIFTPRTMAALSMETLTAVTMPSAYKQLPAQFASHPLLYPSERALDNSVFAKSK